MWTRGIHTVFFLTMLRASAQDLVHAKIFTAGGDSSFCNNTLFMGSNNSSRSGADGCNENQDASGHGDSHAPVAITIGEHPLCNLPQRHGDSNSTIEFTLKTVHGVMAGADYQLRVSVDLPSQITPHLLSSYDWKFSMAPSRENVAVREYLVVPPSVPSLENMWLLMSVEVVDAHPAISAGHSLLALVEKRVYVAKCSAPVAHQRKPDDQALVAEKRATTEYRGANAGDKQHKEWENVLGGQQESSKESSGYTEIQYKREGVRGSKEPNGLAKNKEGKKKQEEAKKACKIEKADVEMYRDEFAINFLHDQHSKIEVIETSSVLYVAVGFTLFPVWSEDSMLDIDAVVGQTAKESTNEDKSAGLAPKDSGSEADRSQELQFYLNGEFMSKANLVHTHSLCGWKVVGTSDVVLYQDVEGCDASVGVVVRKFGELTVLDVRVLGMSNPRGSSHVRWHPVSRLYFIPQRSVVVYEAQILVFLFLTSCEIGRDAFTCVQGVERLGPLLTEASEVRIFFAHRIDPDDAQRIKAAVRCERVSMIGMVAESFSQESTSTGRMIHMDPILSPENMTILVMEDNLEYPRDYFAVARRAVTKASSTILGSFAIGHQGYQLDRQVAEAGESCEMN